MKSNSAKTAIRKFIAKKNADLVREEKIAKGRQSVIDAFKDRDIEEAEAMKLINDQKVFDHFEVAGLDELLIGVTGRKPTTSAIIDFLGIKKPIVFRSTPRVKSGAGSECPVYCIGADKIAIELASCCTPIPGDGIIGYITRGKGVKVHRTNCPNA